VITGAAPTSTLHESRLKIIFRSVESDSESSSEITKLRLRISESFRRTFSKKFKKSQKISKKSEIFRKKRYFPSNALTRSWIDTSSVKRELHVAQTAKAEVAGPRPPPPPAAAATASVADGF
jgi:hypothetical protein